MGKEGERLVDYFPHIKGRFAKKLAEELEGEEDE